MIAPGTFAKRPSIVTQAMERRGLAFLHSLADTCREWPELRKWLCEDFVGNAKTRENFNALVDSPARTANPASFGLAEMAEQARGWRMEKARMQFLTGASAPRIYGGRTWSEMEQIVYRYEGGVTELGASILARHWRKTGALARFAPELLRAGAELLDAVIRGGETHLLTNLSRSVGLLTGSKKIKLRATLGHADWWKLQATLYMLRTPHSAYRTRDVRAHLAKLGITISSLDFRRFCKRHCIARDERAGRPRSRLTASAVGSIQGLGLASTPDRPASVRGGTCRSKARKDRRARAPATPLSPRSTHLHAH